MPFTDLDKIFWARTGLGVVGGLASELLFGCKLVITASKTASCAGGAMPDYSSGILLGCFLFIGSWYLFKNTIGKKFPKDEQNKIYTTGVGSFALLFIFTWILLYTLGVSYLSL